MVDVAQLIQSDAAGKRRQNQKPGQSQRRVGFRIDMRSLLTFVRKLENAFGSLEQKPLGAGRLAQRVGRFQADGLRVRRRPGAALAIRLFNGFGQQHHFGLT